jgi:hypothetical protein
VSGAERASGQRVDSPEDFAATDRGGLSSKTIKAATAESASAKVIATTPTFSNGSTASLRLNSRSIALQRQARYPPRRPIATAYTSPDRAERANSRTLHTLPYSRQNRRTHSTRPSYRTTKYLPDAQSYVSQTKRRYRFDVLANILTPEA